MLEKIQETASWLNRKMSSSPEVAIILGTGLGTLASEIEVVEEWPYSEIPHFPISTVEGHAGKLLYGHLGGRDVLALDGRFHYYEGYSMKEVTFPVRVLHQLGVRTLFVSNAAGGVNTSFKTGDLMIITDHINFMPEHPLRGKNYASLGPRFPDMSQAYDNNLITLCKSLASEYGIPLREGVYLANSGPTYETPAEYRMYRLWGADAVGMSTVPEVIVARHSGMRVFGMSVITNSVASDGNNPISHEEVQRAAGHAAENMARLFRSMISKV